jgi:hypothetical protein
VQHQRVAGDVGDVAMAQLDQVLHRLHHPQRVVQVDRRERAGGVGATDRDRGQAELSEQGKP